MDDRHLLKFASDIQLIWALDSASFSIQTLHLVPQVLPLSSAPISDQTHWPMLSELMLLQLNPALSKLKQLICAIQLIKL